MKVTFSKEIFANPLPQLRAVNSFFPFLCQRPDGAILAMHQMGEAFESVNARTYISLNHDQGRTWSEPYRAFDEIDPERQISESAKPIVLPDGSILALGYGFYRDDPNLPMGNVETGGLLPNLVFWSISRDGGKHFSHPQPIETSWPGSVEASAPITVLQDGSWASPITGFPSWDGTMEGKLCGRLLRTYDAGQTWNDDVICQEFPGDAVTCYEMRLCQLDDGTLVVIGWNEDILTGERLPNHYSFSTDNGQTFSVPISTGIQGQASFVMSLPGQRIFALHALRRDTDRPGIYACIVDFSNHTWQIEKQQLIWEPARPVTRNPVFAEIFSFLKFGQPGAILLADGSILMSHWFSEDGVYRTVATGIEL